MNNEELLQWLGGIYATLGRIDIKATPENTKNLSAIYYEIERVLQLLQEVGGNNDGE